MIRVGTIVGEAAEVTVIPPSQKREDPVTKCAVSDVKKLGLHCFR